MSKRLLVILILGFSLRMAGINFGLPHLYHADEPIIVNHALAYGTGDLNPHFFKIPPLVSYCLFVFYGVFFLFGILTGRFQSTNQFEELFYSDPSAFYMIGRVTLGAVLGTACIWALYKAVLANSTKRKALIAALLISVCFLHVKDSHYIYTDIPLTLVMIIAMTSFFDLLKSGGNEIKKHFIAGIWIGLATAVKYNGAALAIPYFICCIVSRNRFKPKHLIIACGVSLITYSLLNPFTWLDMKTFIKEITLQASSQGGVGLTHHLMYSLSEGISSVWLLTACAGIIRGVMKKEKTILVLSAWCFIYYFILVLGGQHYDRYVLVLTPFIAWIAADFIGEIWHYRSFKILSILLLTSGLYQNLLKSIKFDRVMASEDNRSLAKKWIEENIPSGSRIALDWDFYMPRLNFSQDQLHEKKKLLSAIPNYAGAQMRRLNFLINNKSGFSPNYTLHFLSKNSKKSDDRPLFSQPLIENELNALKLNNISYVVVGEFPHGRDPKSPTFVKELETQGVLLKEFTPYEDLENFREHMDKQPLTGGPFLWNDLKKRVRNGMPIRIYKIEP